MIYEWGTLRNVNRTLALVFACLCVLSVVPAAGIALGGQAAENASANNTTRHVDPAAVDVDGNLSDVESYLVGQLGEYLSASAVQLSQGQYDQAKSLVGPAYRSALEKYVDVAGETDGPNHGDTFQQAQSQQERYVEQVQAYRETAQAYREARANGEDARARRLARELNEQARAINRTAANLTATYDTLANATGVSLADATEAVTEVRANVTETQAEIRAESFIETRLTARAVNSTTSFTNPLQVQGRLTMANGTALANRTIRVAIGSRTVRVRTDSTGRFATSYRPVTLPANETSITVRYRPRASALYLGSTATVTATIEQVTPTLTLTNATAAAAFGAPIQAQGRLTVNGTAVPGLPVVLVADGTRLATGRTAANGSISLSASLPATVPAGTRTLTVRLPLSGRAVASVAVDRSLAVRETATNLTVDATAQNGEVRVTGRLTTRAGQPVGGRPVAIERNGTAVTTVTTDGEGRYAATIPAETGRRYQVTAAYDEPGTNLKPATTTATVTMPSAGPGGQMVAVTPGGLFARLRGLVLGNPLAAGAAVGGLLVVAIAAVSLWRRRGTSAAAETAATATTTAESDAGTAGAAAATSQSPDGDPLETARELADAGETDAAVEAAYRAVRASLRERVATPPGATHGEFLAACQEAELDDVDAIASLTDAYEQAAFGPQPVTDAVVESTLTTAGDLLQ